MRITVGILTYNEEKNIERCLESLTRQTYRDFEVWLVDNGSQDRTVELGQKWVPANRWRHRSENHMGAARAQVMLLAQTEWVAFLDADCEAPPHWLQSLVEAAIRLQNQESCCAAVGGDNTPALADSWGRLLALAQKSLWGTGGSLQAQRIQNLHSVRHLSTCNILYQRSAVLAVGNFSLDMPRVCEDVELNWRLHQAHYKMWAIPGATVVHHHQPQWRAWCRKMYLYGYGHTLVARRHADYRPLRLFGPVGALILCGFVGWPLLLVYLIALIFSALALSSKHVVRVVSLWVATHFFYAGGLLYGCYDWARSALARSCTFQRRA